MCKTFATLLLLILCSVGVTSAQTSQTIDSKLRQKLASYDSEKTTPLQQLIELGQHLSIPMGIEWINEPEEKPVRPIHLTNTTPRAVLSNILAQKEGYRLTLEEGLVHISHRSFADDQLNFLNLRFPQYSVKDTSLREADYWLGIAIKRLLHPHRNMGGGLGGVSLEKDFNVRNLSFWGNDLTVRQVLSKLVLAHGRSLWVVRLNPTLLMEGEPFYASGTSSDGKGSPDFVWDLLPLMKKPDRPEMASP
jgi:hypothetical protein